jgi:hypothetical protein
MKTALRLSIAAFGLAIFNISTVVVEGQSYTDNYGTWYYTDNGTITITFYTGSGGDVTIPSTINGLPVIASAAVQSRYSSNISSLRSKNLDGTLRYRFATAR